MRKTVKTLMIVAGSLLIIACAPETQQQVTQRTDVVPTKAQTSLYNIQVHPLSLEECARCHISIFSVIKERGGKHQKECTFCHTQYHVYNPKKQNWDEIMPKCTNCHGLKHGDKFAKCFTCHSQAHAPKQELAVNEEFAKWCVECHTSENKEITQYKSAHTDLGCAYCHAEKHGNIQTCDKCHEPHTKEQTYKDCLTCHKPHSPKNIPAFSKETPSSVCGACHSQELIDLNSSQAKHKNLTCSSCHTKHKFIPNCRDCHGEPHSAEVHKRFTDCLRCHMNAHHLAKLQVIPNIK